MAVATSANQTRRTVLITGCSDGGLGSALALEFHKDPSIRVFATARGCVAEVSRLTTGRLDVLVNNAGAGYSMPLMDISVPAAQSLFNLNVWSYISVSQTFLPLLRASAGARKEHQPIIVNHTAHAGVYHASKAASAVLSDTLRLELKPFGIRVVEIKTGGVRSNFFDNLKADVSAAPKLPEESIYASAKEEIESVMRGENTAGMVVGADVWAKAVVSSLVKKKPKAVIWTGWGWWVGWLLTVLPIPHTAMDGQWVKLGKLDFLERRLKEQSGSKE